MIVRKAELNDIEQCIALCRIEEFEMPGEQYPDREVLIPSLNQIFLVAEKDGQLLGLIVGYYLVRKMVYIDLLTVAEQYRGMNIGTLLLDGLRDELKKMAVDNYFLIAPTKKDKTLAFYRKNGLIEGSQYTFFHEDLSIDKSEG